MNYGKCWNTLQNFGVCSLMVGNVVVVDEPWSQLASFHETLHMNSENVMLPVVISLSVVTWEDVKSKVPPVTDCRLNITDQEQRWVRGGSVLTKRTFWLPSFQRNNWNPCFKRSGGPLCDGILSLWSYWRELMWSRTVLLLLVFSLFACCRPHTSLISPPRCASPPRCFVTAWPLTLADDSLQRRMMVSRLRCVVCSSAGSSKRHSVLTSDLSFSVQGIYLRLPLLHVCVDLLPWLFGVRRVIDWCKHSYVFKSMLYISCQRNWRPMLRTGR